MSIEIMNNYNNYAADYRNTSKKADSARNNERNKESGVTTSTVELKTSTPGVTRTEQIKTGFDNVNDYSKYLQGKYRYMNTGITSMEGVPTTVTVSGAFLKKCMDDPEKAKFLEENLAAIPESVKSLCNSVRMSPGSPVVTYATYQIDDNGNISMISGSTNDPDGKIARENAERKAKEKKAEKEKQAEKHKEKKAEEEKAAERRAEKNEIRKEQSEKSAKARETHKFTLSAVGTDVKSVTKNLIEISLGTYANKEISCFDITV